MDTSLPQSDNSPSSEELENLRQELIRRRHTKTRQNVIGNLVKSIVNQALYDAKINNADFDARVNRFDIISEIEQILQEIAAMDWNEAIKSYKCFFIDDLLFADDIKQCRECKKYGLKSDLKGYSHKTGDILEYFHAYCGECINKFNHEYHERCLDQEVHCSSCTKLYSIRHFCKWREEFKELFAVVPKHYDYCCKECAERIWSRYDKICDVCNNTYRAKTEYEHTYLCTACNIDIYITESKRVQVHIGRANRLKLKASLTFKQWLATLDYFDWECAYCLKGFSCLEHYIPLSLNGGTTSGNCLPACDSCNAKKNNHHPDQLDSIFPAENLARIRQYLSEQSA